VTIGGVVFDNIVYDADVDVLYLHVGSPEQAVDYDATAEGDSVRFDAEGGLVGFTILSPKLRLDQGGKIELTLPEHKLVVTDIGDAFEQRLPKYAPDMVKVPGGVQLGRIEFDDVEYDRTGDTLYLRAAGDAVSHGASQEFNPLEFDADGNLVAVTIGEARATLRRQGRIVVTLPDGRSLELADVGDALAAA
jgi:uncharacterized protein YuzE